MGHAQDPRSDDELLVASREDPAAFAEIYRRHARAIAAFFARRTPGTDLAADLTAETFAAALAGRRSYDPARGEARGWLFGIAQRQLVGYQRRGAVEARARRKLGMERLELDDAQLARIDEAVAAEGPSAAVLLDELPPEQAGPLRARVLEEHSYARIAVDHGISQPAARQRVSRGLATLRTRLGKDPR